MRGLIMFPGAEKPLWGIEAIRTYLIYKQWRDKPMWSTFMRFVRASVATLAAVGVTNIGVIGPLLPPPWNLTLIPLLMAIGKFIRDTYNPTNDPAHWSNKIPI